LRKGVADAKIKVREAEVSLHCAKSDFKKFGATYVPTVESIRVSEALVTGEERLRWWKNELGRREAWLKGHEAMAKVRKAEEKARILREKEAEEERLRAVEAAKEAGKERRKAVEQERENVREKTRAGKVEVVEIEDSEDDGNEDAGVKLLEEGVT
jgi:hypothetical protein